MFRWKNVRHGVCFDEDTDGRFGSFRILTLDVQYVCVGAVLFQHFVLTFVKV